MMDVAQYRTILLAVLVAVTIVFFMLRAEAAPRGAQRTIDVKDVHGQCWRITPKPMFFRWRSGYYVDFQPVQCP